MYVCMYVCVYVCIKQGRRKKQEETKGGWEGPCLHFRTSVSFLSFRFLFVFLFFVVFELLIDSDCASYSVEYLPKFQPVNKTSFINWLEKVAKITRKEILCTLP